MKADLDVEEETSKVTKHLGDILMKGFEINRHKQLLNFYFNVSLFTGDF
jgi:hypothetical protein